MPVAAGANLVEREPEHADDAGIEPQGRVGLADAAGEGEAQPGGIAVAVAAGFRVRRTRQIYAHQMLGDETAGRLLAGLTNHRIDRRFARLQVPGRVVQAEAIAGLLFDEQVLGLPAPFAAGDRGRR